jgi:MFS family permease
MTKSLPSHFRRNFTVILVDYIFFSVAFSFADPGTVMPAFVEKLTDAEPIVGLVGTVWAAGWLLPQLMGAAFLTDHPHKKPYLMRLVCAGRPLIMLLGLTMWAGLPRYPSAMLTVFFVTLACFMLLDGVASVAWFDILARAVPLSRRGRLLGTAQLVSGILGVLVGAAVEATLRNPSLPFPRNYALLFTLAGLAHIPSVVALSLIKEPVLDEAFHRIRPSVRGLLDQLTQVWRDDADFRRLILTRWLIGLIDLAVTFYVLHAGQRFGIPQGRLLAARMIGGILSSLGFGWLIERLGPRPVIWIGGAAAVASPLLALLLELVRPLSSQVVTVAYFGVYILLGITYSSRLLGHQNYVLEIAPRDRRPLYIGLANTLTGLLVPASFLGGVLLDATSYVVLFSVTMLCTTAGLVASLRLRNLQQAGGK